MSSYSMEDFDVRPPEFASDGGEIVIRYVFCGKRRHKLMKRIAVAAGRSASSVPKRWTFGRVVLEC